MFWKIAEMDGLPVMRSIFGEGLVVSFENDMRNQRT
jgi:hypothetical protein